MNIPVSKKFGELPHYLISTVHLIT